MKIIAAYAELLVNATMIAMFACWRLKQKGNEEAMLTAKDHGRKDLLSPTKVGSTTIYCILHTFAYRT